ncbi:hypothetical protein [Nocardia vinacea]|uniref:hypothetical protein n=1 Tax=Nocardia vinacea TaxID=96468 RepID=UPI0012F6C926|nr:hypothetical protein [Nocardia vinacea]
MSRLAVTGFDDGYAAMSSAATRTRGVDSTHSNALEPAKEPNSVSRSALATAAKRRHQSQMRAWQPRTAWSARREARFS